MFLGHADYYSAPAMEDLMIKLGIAGGVGHTGMELLSPPAEHFVAEPAVLMLRDGARAPFACSLASSSEIDRLWRLPALP